MKKLDSAKARDKFGSMIYRSCFVGNGNAHYYESEDATWLTDGYVAISYPCEQFPFNRDLLKPIDLSNSVSSSMSEYGYANTGAMAVCFDRLIVRLISDKSKTSAQKKYLDMFQGLDLYIHKKNNTYPVRILDEMGNFWGIIMPTRGKADFWEKLI